MAGIYIDINIAESVEVIIWQCGLINNICNNAEHNAITMVTDTCSDDTLSPFHDCHGSLKYTICLAWVSCLHSSEFSCATY